MFNVRLLKRKKAEIDDLVGELYAETLRKIRIKVEKQEKSFDNKEKILQQKSFDEEYKNWISHSETNKLLKSLSDKQKKKQEKKYDDMAKEWKANLEKHLGGGKRKSRQIQGESRRSERIVYGSRHYRNDDEKDKDNDKDNEDKNNKDSNNTGRDSKDNEDATCRGNILEYSAPKNILEYSSAPRIQKKSTTLKVNPPNLALPKDVPYHLSRSRQIQGKKSSPSGQVVYGSRHNYGDHDEEDKDNNKDSNDEDKNNKDSNNTGRDSNDAYIF